MKPINAEQTISQWAQTNDLASDGLDDDNIDDIPEATTNGQVQGGHAYTDSTYSDATTGNVVLSKLTVAGMGHAWSGGDAMGSYIDPKGPDASRMAWDFFASGVLPVAVDAGTSGDAASAPVATDDAGATMKAVPGGCTFGGRAVPSALPLLALLITLVLCARRRVCQLSSRAWTRRRAGPGPTDASARRACPPSVRRRPPRRARAAPTRRRCPRPWRCGR